MEAPSSLQSLRARAALRDAFALAPEAAVKAGVATVLTINADGDYKVEQPADEVAFMAAPAVSRHAPPSGCTRGIVVRARRSMGRAREVVGRTTAGGRVARVGIDARVAK